MWFSTKALYYKVKFLSVLWTYTFPHNSSSMEEFHLFHGKGPLLSTGPKGGLLSMLLFVLQKLLTVISAKHFRVPCIFIWVSPTWNNWFSPIHDNYSMTILLWETPRPPGHIKHTSRPHRKGVAYKALYLRAYAPFPTSNRGKAVPRWAYAPLRIRTSPTPPLTLYLAVFTDKLGERQPDLLQFLPLTNDPTDVDLHGTDLCRARVFQTQHRT